MVNKAAKVRVSSEDGSRSFGYVAKSDLKPATAKEVYNSFDYGQAAAQGSN